MSPTDENLSNLGTAISQGEEDLRIRVSEQNQIKSNGPIGILPLSSGVADVQANKPSHSSKLYISRTDVPHKGRPHTAYIRV
jgi:hypothetical protein